jgi:hypothetical protein
MNNEQGRRASHPSGACWKSLGDSSGSVTFDSLVHMTDTARICQLAPLHCRNALHYNCSARLEAFVDDQITVRLPTPLGRTLRRTSRRLGRRPSDVVRMALEAFLQTSPPATTRPAERVEHLIGSLASGVPDLGERHREYVLAALKHGR